jgi:hypothetical protein
MTSKVMNTTNLYHLITLFIGCSTTVCTDEKFYHVVKIVPISDDNTKCKYYLASGHIYTNFMNDFEIIDSIGKYSINDSIKVNLLK